ncbi:enoyl-CoA hydratase-related protein [Candidatus Nitronereus thalassa]|uniref:Enoyl-CoA hydratase-related protein n=1 Tax=Candidatus Nitronereus thalassa TaxID=3020898 RepID=A0ABU3K4B1_9BACT|nr:enoyl-CoA hydratase-related protein [Candidatus Nitronereus thalassa]MDT7041216.1 enoyl-CoA hydratase-related protein [Candidatus Nitronereus thalassa]
MKSMSLQSEQPILFQGPWVTLKVGTPKSPYFTRECFENLKLVIELTKAEKKFKAIVLEGEGRYFSAGASRQALLKSRPNTSILHYAGEVPQLLMAAPVPTIAVMKGHAVGGGFILGLLCDIPLMAEESLYGVNFMALGFSPGMGSTFILEEAIGAPFARRLLLTGALVKGREFKKAGGPLSATVCARADLDSQVTQILAALEDIPRDVLETYKHALRKKREQLLRKALDDERVMQYQIFSKPQTIPHIERHYPVSKKDDFKKDRT